MAVKVAPWWWGEAWRLLALQKALFIRVGGWVWLEMLILKFCIRVLFLEQA